MVSESSFCLEPAREPKIWPWSVTLKFIPNTSDVHNLPNERPFHALPFHWKPLNSRMNGNLQHCGSGYDMSKESSRDDTYTSTSWDLIWPICTCSLGVLFFRTDSVINHCYVAEVRVTHAVRSIIGFWVIHHRILSSFVFGTTSTINWNQTKSCINVRAQLHCCHAVEWNLYAETWAIKHGPWTLQPAQPTAKFPGCGRPRRSEAGSAGESFFHLLARRGLLSGNLVHNQQLESIWNLRLSRPKRVFPLEYLRSEKLLSGAVQCLSSGSRRHKGVGGGQAEMPWFKRCRRCSHSWEVGNQKSTNCKWFKWYMQYHQQCSHDNMSC